MRHFALQSFLVLVTDDSLLPEKGPIHLKSDQNYLKSIYESDGKCALWIFPYHCIQFKNIMEEKEKSDPTELQYANLMEKIVKSTVRPKYLRIWKIKVLTIKISEKYWPTPNMSYFSALTVWLTNIDIK